MAFVGGALLGDAELKRALDSLPKTLRNQAIRLALRQEAEPVRDLAKTLVSAQSTRTGRLARSLKIRARRQRRGIIGVNILTGTREELGIPPNATGYYPAAIEFGWRQAKSGRHIPQQSYMRAALKSRESGMLSRLQQAARLAVETVVARKLKALTKKL